MTEASGMGRRERKKAATRRAISDIATRLFLERGFDHVSIREIADRADVSPTTVFAYFPQKEALLFDEDDEQREKLVAAVRDRPAGTSIAQALHAFLSAGVAEDLEHGHDAAQRFMQFLDSTPSVADYAARMWTRHERSLAEVIAEQSELAEPDDEIRAYARFVLQSRLLANASAEPQAALDAAFRLLDHGWPSVSGDRGSTSA